MMQTLAAGSARRSWAANAVRGLLLWAGRVGADPADSTDTALQKRLMVALSVGLLPLTLLWSVIYWIAGVPLSAAVPAIYTAATPINTLLFAWTRNLGFYRFTQLLMYLVLPWLLMMSLGGFRESSVVVI
jgi:guanylate cyclase